MTIMKSIRQKVVAPLAVGAASIVFGGCGGDKEEPKPAETWGITNAKATEFYFTEYGGSFGGDVSNDKENYYFSIGLTSEASATHDLTISSLTIVDDPKEIENNSPAIGAIKFTNAKDIVFTAIPRKKDITKKSGADYSFSVNSGSIIQAMSFDQKAYERYKNDPKALAVEINRQFRDNMVGDYAPGATTATIPVTMGARKRETVPSAK